MTVPVKLRTPRVAVVCDRCSRMYRTPHWPDLALCPHCNPRKEQP